MESSWECVIAGGPQHGQVHRLEWETSGRIPLVITAEDGERCVAAASRNGNSRFIYLHPSVTGAQILTLLTAQGAGTK